MFLIRSPLFFFFQRLEVPTLWDITVLQLHIHMLFFFQNYVVPLVRFSKIHCSQYSFEGE